ncbi:MAG: serine protease [Proteobacteria bacterium]|nr:MAG: serine protease [Pseudomonadota bacterium]
MRSHSLILISLTLSLVTAALTASGDAPMSSGNASRLQYAESAEARRIYQIASPLVFPIQISASRDSPKLAYGTGFVVRRQGLIATNFHVIERAVIEPTRYKPFVIVDGMKYEAKILDFSITADLALLKIERPFERELEIRDELPEVGEKLFSVGLPEDLSMMITEGNAGGMDRDLLSENIVLSSPLNPGMSGGPSFDYQGRVRGVNVSILRKSQNIAFIVPARQLRALVDHLDGNGAIAQLTSRAAFQIFDAQIAEASHRAVTEMVQTKAERRKISGLLAPTPPLGVKCWEYPNSGLMVKSYQAMKLSLRSMQVCSNSRGIPLDPKLKLGFWSEGYAVFGNGLSLPEKRGMDHAFEAVPKLMMMDDFFNRVKEDEPDHYSLPRCSNHLIQNANKIRFRVNLCVRGYKAFPRLFDVALKAMSLSETGPNALAIYRMSGISNADAQQVMSYALDTLAWERP